MSGLWTVPRVPGSDKAKLFCTPGEIRQWKRERASCQDYLSLCAESHNTGAGRNAGGDAGSANRLRLDANALFVPAASVDLAGRLPAGEAAKEEAPRAEGIAAEEIAAEGIAAEGNAAEGNAAVGNDAEGTGLRASAEALTPAVASASGGTGRSSDIINRHRRARRQEPQQRRSPQRQPRQQGRQQLDPRPPGPPAQSQPSPVPLPPRTANYYAVLARERGEAKVGPTNAPPPEPCTVADIQVAAPSPPEASRARAGLGAADYAVDASAARAMDARRPAEGRLGESKAPAWVEDAALLAAIADARETAAERGASNAPSPRLPPEARAAAQKKEHERRRRAWTVQGIALCERLGLPYRTVDAKPRPKEPEEAPASAPGAPGGRRDGDSVSGTGCGSAVPPRHPAGDGGRQHPPPVLDRLAKAGQEAPGTLGPQ